MLLAKKCLHLVQKNATRILLNIMTRYLDSEEIMVHILSTLGNLSSKGKNESPAY
jgi:hypothetical protein